MKKTLSPLFGKEGISSYNFLYLYEEIKNQGFPHDTAMIAAMMVALHRLTQVKSSEYDREGLYLKRLFNKFDRHFVDIDLSTKLAALFIWNVFHRYEVIKALGYNKTIKSFIEDDEGMISQAELLRHYERTEEGAKQ